MVCSITINRKAHKDSEVKYVHYEPVKDPLVLNDEKLDYEFLITNLYEKVGELKRRIEVLENERKG